MSPYFEDTVAQFDVISDKDDSVVYEANRRQLQFTDVKLHLRSKNFSE